MPGFSAECVSGQHDACAERDCRCLCHPKVQELMRGAAQRPKVTPSFSSMVCSQCSKVPRIGDSFCRADGSRLITGKQCSCGKAAEPDDTYCGSCGQKFGALAVPVPELSEEELKALEAAARARPSDVEVPPVEVH